jgi:hypothetical protein
MAVRGGRDEDGEFDEDCGLQKVSNAGGAIVVGEVHDAGFAVDAANGGDLGALDGRNGSGVADGVVACAGEKKRWDYEESYHSHGKGN